jgi:hypothetical protein
MRMALVLELFPLKPLSLLPDGNKLFGCKTFLWKENE